jgi:beta-glucoside operon transcriptional antiterminator
MHLINAEAESSDLHSVMMILKIIDEIDKIVEQCLKITLDKESFYYSRFTMHLRYLVQRLANDKQSETGGAGMLHTLRQEYPDIYYCALQISDYLHGTWGWLCNEEEVLYLMLHISRVQEKMNQ